MIEAFFRISKRCQKSRLSPGTAHGQCRCSPNDTRKSASWPQAVSRSLPARMSVASTVSHSASMRTGQVDFILSAPRQNSNSIVASVIDRSTVTYPKGIASVGDGKLVGTRGSSSAIRRWPCAIRARRGPATEGRNMPAGVPLKPRLVLGAGSLHATMLSVLLTHRNRTSPSTSSCRRSLAGPIRSNPPSPSWNLSG